MSPFLAALALLVVASAASSDAVGERLREIGRASAKVQTLRAHFVQEKRLTIVRDVLRSSGTFTLDKRGRVAWDVVEPEAVRIVITRQGVFAGGKRIAGGDAAKMSPLPMLEGMSGIFGGLSEATAKDFEVTLVERDRLRLVPRRREVVAWVAAIEVTVDPQTQTPARVRLEEPGGDVTDITFREVAINPPLDDAAFAP